MSVLKRSLLPAAVLAAAVALFLGYFAIVAQAETGISETPRTDVMQVTNGEVLDSVVIGNRIVVVGSFTQVKDAGSTATIDQPYIAAYNAETGAFDASFRPDVNNYINSIAVGPGNTLFIGGQFDTVNNEPHRRIAKLSSSGAVDSAFQTTVGSTVNVVKFANNKVYFGGRFVVVNGQERISLAAVDATTGALDETTDFDFTFSNQAGGGVAVRWLDISPDGNFMFVSHGARFIDGEIRSGIARFDISPNETTLSEWQTLLYDNERDLLGGVIRARRVAISPDGSYVVLLTSGGDRPPAADTAVRFPTSGGADVQADWVSRHFDTVLGVAISDSAIYVGGHFQFQEAPGSDNPFPGDPLNNFGFGQNQGPLALGSQVVQREQIGALDPNTGKSLDWNPGSDSFIGVQSLTWDDQYGLLVGHDGNRFGGINNIGRHAIFPIGSTPEPGNPEQPGLPPGERFACNAVLNGDTAVVTFLGDLGSSVQVLRNGSWAGTASADILTINALSNDQIQARVRGANYQAPHEDFSCRTSVGGQDTTRSTSVFTPQVGSVTNGGTVTISGQSTAPDGMSHVRISVRRQDNLQFLTPEGTWTSAWTPIDIALNTNDTLADWSLDVNLEWVGEYDLTARTFDANGIRDAVIRRNFTVGGAASAPPEVTVYSPIVRSNQVQLSGIASDDVGVASVNLLIQNNQTKQYFRLDGTVGGAQSFATTLTNPDATSTAWGLTLTDLPVGTWTVVADAFDGTSQRDRARLTFTRIGVTAPPEIAVTSGIGQKVPANSTVTFSGVATAPAGVGSVQVYLRNAVDRSGVGQSGELTRKASFFIIPGTSGGLERNWSYTSPTLEAGTYDVQFRVYDAIGALDVVDTQFVVGPVGDDTPRTTFDPASRFVQGVDSLDTQISGRAFDDVAVSAVAVTIFDHQLGLWVGPNGTSSRTPEPFFADLSAPGGRATDWSLDFRAPKEGFYQYTVRAIDSSGQAASTAVFGTLRAHPGDTLPTVEVAQPLNGVVIEDNRILITGTAGDDVALADVELRIRNEATGLYLQTNGSFGGNHWLSASLTNVGGDRTSWDYSSPELSDGTWRIWVRAVDNNRQDTLPVVVRTVTLR